MYDPSANTWTTEASLTTARFALAATSGPCPTNTTTTCIFALGAGSGPCSANTSTTCLYAVGGKYSSGTTLNTVEMYDPSANTWTIEASLHTARFALGAASGPCRTSTTHACIYAIGGRDNS